MGPLHLILFFTGFIALSTLLTFFSLLYSHPLQAPGQTEFTVRDGKSRLRAFFSFRAPSSLFSSSAIISLTDDNSTFFLARPADFGPNLASEGLSGCLWVGNGFSDGSRKSGRITLGVEGELGCNDVPGWVGGDIKFQEDLGAQLHHDSRSDIRESGLSWSNGGRAGPTNRRKDGTDEYRYEPRLEPASMELGETSSHKPKNHGGSSPDADIRSLQESAEITGKVVLLSRGGCGFLEKVMWAQRRGAAALIVGDDTPGGPLLTMYARGDTSNVTIPSLFTSHTTAHLLSTLIPSEGLTRKSQSSKLNQINGKAGRVAWGDQGAEAEKLRNDRAILNHATGSAKTSPVAQSSLVDVTSEHERAQRSDLAIEKDGDMGWLHFLLSGIGLLARSHAVDLLSDSRRPPSSGRLDWINYRLNDDLHTAQKNDLRPEYAIPSRGEGTKSDHLTSSREPADKFIIGVHDWRDKDLIVASSSPEDSLTDPITTKPKSLPSETLTNKPKKLNEIINSHGGIITPGSGEYAQPIVNLKSKDIPQGVELVDIIQNSEGGSTTWLSHVLHDGDGDDRTTQERLFSPWDAAFTERYAEDLMQEKNPNVQDSRDEHEGLWVTLTPTTMSTSPFLDTLLVLVVSPLITLTVVYALLLLRSRIRRRRWRAPKSVVDRLPVRTYQTMSCSSISSSSQSATPPTSSPTSPLLQSPLPRPLSRPRTESQAKSITSVAAPATSEQDTAAISRQQPDNHTRPRGGKRKYVGKQIECVVCLEEYVDGHSRVMSLPCGHEFHAECMYVLKIYILNDKWLISC